MNNPRDDVRDRRRDGELRESELDAALSSAVKESAARIRARVARVIASKAKKDFKQSLSA